MKSKENLNKDLRKIIESSRNTIYRQVNNELLLMNFKIGERLSKIVNPKNGRPALDAKTITSISRTLTQDYGKGFSRQNLSLIIIFYKDYKNCQTMFGGLSWSHYVALLSVKNLDKRIYYENA